MYTCRRALNGSMEFSESALAAKPISGKKDLSLDRAKLHLAMARGPNHKITPDLQTHRYSAASLYLYSDSFVPGKSAS